MAVVTGGSFTAEKLLGRYAGEAQDLTLSGKITLHLKTQAGEKTVHGSFAAHCITWG